MKQRRRKWTRCGKTSELRNKLKAFVELIKFEHTVFALPFAYLGMLLSVKAVPSFGEFFWITAAMVSARTVGMTLNRIVDLNTDQKNPRTKNRPLITGEFSLAGAWGTMAAGLVIFFISAWMLNPLCFKLSFIAIFFLSTYHYVKRFSYLCHFTLGLVLAMAPIGGWLAVTGVFSWVVVPLALAVLFWVSGFDIIYSIQDLDFDRTYRLHSIPVRFGRQQALKISSYCHLMTLIFLILFGFFSSLGLLYWSGVLISAILLKIEHSLVSDGELDQMDTAFFMINGWMGILLLVFTFLDLYQ